MSNYFQIFSLPISYDIDVNNLQQQYRNLQRTVHPDKFVNAPAQERRLALQKSAQINDAFQVLKNPLKRAEHLLTLNNVENDSQLTSEFLMEQMELREELEEIQQQKEPSADLLLNNLDKKINLLNDELKLYFAENNFNNAKINVNKLHFLYKLYEEVLNLD
jgi:molecular chaperone HscB